MQLLYEDRSEVDLVKGLVAGVAGGLLASFLMEQFQAAWSAAGAANVHVFKKRRGRQARPYDRESSERHLGKNYRPQDSGGLQALAGEAVHYGMGAGAAAVYGVAAEIAPIVTVADGLAFGTGVWLLADEVAVPKAGLSKPPKEIPLTTHIYALASHSFTAGSPRRSSRNTDRPVILRSPQGVASTGCASARSVSCVRLPEPCTTCRISRRRTKTLSMNSSATIPLRL